MTLKAITGVAPDSQNIVKYVIYTPDTEKADVVYYDVTDPEYKQLLNQTKAQGKYDESIVFQVDTQYQADPKLNHFEVDFVYGMQAAHDTSAATETIHYVYEGGTQAHDDYDAQPVMRTKPLQLLQGCW